MKYQVAIILLAGLVAYVQAVELADGDTPTLIATLADGSTIPGAGITTGTKIKFDCQISKDKVAVAEYYRGTDKLPNSPAAKTEAAGPFTQPFEYTTVAADEGTSVYKCLVKKLSTTATKSADSATKTIIIMAPTTTAAPTTAGSGSGGSGSGAGSNSPVMAIFLLSIAAMCF